VLVFFVLDRSRRPTRAGWLRLVIAGAAPIVAWTAVALVAWGDVLPSTFDAKRAQAASGMWPLLLSSEGLGFATKLLAWPYNLRELLGANSPLGKAMVVVMLGLALVGLGATVLRLAAWQITLTLVTSTALLWIAYGYVLRIPSYPWYYSQGVYTLIVLTALGIDALARVVRSPTARVALVAVLAGALVASSFTRVYTGPSAIRSDYETVGRWLDAHAPPRATVAAAEIGKLGWYSERDMVDYLGLLDRAADDHVRARDFGWWASRYQPDYWVTYRQFTDADFLASRCRSEHFEKVFATASLDVYRRTSPVPPPGEC